MINPLVQSALNQKTGAKPWSNPRERSQGGAAMLRLEEASSRCPVGSPLGHSSGRASPHRAKSVFSASFWRIPVAALAVSGAQTGVVLRAITQDAWLGHLTGEVPRCPPPPAGVTASYKRDAKSWPHASVAGTASYRPRPWGCQQSQSSLGAQPCSDQRLNRKQFVQAPETGTVSQAIEAPKWPAGTSSRQPACPLRNIPTGSAAAQNGPGTTI